MTIQERIIRKGLAFLLAAGLFLGLAGPARAASVSDFYDVSGSAWYYDAVSYVTGQGLFQGTSSTEFSPGVSMTRGMFITVLGRYAGVDPSTWCAGYITGSGVNLRSGPGTSYGVMTVLSKNTTVTLLGKSGSWYKVKAGSYTGYVSGDYVAARYHSFSDVDYSAYYAGYAIWAYEKGIVNGMGSESVFAPGDDVTREQACCLLSRYASAAGLSLSQSAAAVTFTDDGLISSWAKTSVYAMQRSGVVNGTTGGAFDPANSATRAEAAAMFQRFAAAAGRSTSTPAATPTPTPTPTDGQSSVPPALETSTPTPTPTPTPTGEAFPEDSPATFADGSVSVKNRTIRVGLFVSTKSIDTCVSSVTLENTGGSGFEYGSMDSGRNFIPAGTISEAKVKITTDGSSFTVTDSGGNVVYTSGGAFAIHPVGGKPVTRVNGEYRYYGDFELRQAYNASGYITLINYVDVEDYVKGVVPYEFVNTWPAETLKAAAVAVRSYVMSYDWNTYDQFGFDIPSGSGAQLYHGRGSTVDNSYFAATDAAADATAGQYLTCNGKICVTLYSSCDGGATKSSSQVFGTNYSYLTGKTDPYEQAAADDISGYASRVSSSHKVGMSQWGAYAMAKYYDKDYQDILGFYYTGTHLQYGA